MQTTLPPTLCRGSACFADVSQATAGKRQHSSRSAAFNRGEAYPNTLYTDTGQKAGAVPARGVAGTLNYLDIIDDS